MKMEDNAKKQGILVVSFGTSHPGTRSRTIDAIEQDIQDAFPGCPVYRAWTSNVIIDKVRVRDGYQVDTVAEALDRMEADGIKKVVLQPTHVMDAYENKQMKLTAFSCVHRFEQIAFGAPLLSTKEHDLDQVVDALMQEFSGMDQDTALVLMGHGTTLDAQSVYAALEKRFQVRGYEHVFVGTIGDHKVLEVMKYRVRENGYSKVVLAPLLIVAGAHATKDMAGAHDNSWKSQFTAGGFEVSCVMKGLGEYKAIRQIFVEHAKMRMIHL